MSPSQIRAQRERLDAINKAINPLKRIADEELQSLRAACARLGHPNAVPKPMPIGGFQDPGSCGDDVVNHEPSMGEVLICPDCGFNEEVRRAGT